MEILERRVYTLRDNYPKIPRLRENLVKVDPCADRLSDKFDIL